MRRAGADDSGSGCRFTAPVAWQVEDRAGVALLWSLFGLGWVLVLVSTFLINHFELFGLQQVFARLRRRALPEPEFRNAACCTATYGHPLSRACCWVSGRCRS
jgi:hypothetical protein